MAATSTTVVPPTPSVEVAAPPGPALVGLETPAYVGADARPRARSLAIRASVPLLLLGLWWWGAASGHISSDVLASPGKVFDALRELQQTGQLRDFLWASAVRTLVGVGFGVAVGLSFGIVAGLSKLGEELVDPTMQMARAVPFLALTPLFISWFGIDETFKYLLIGVAAAMPMYAYTYLGVRSVDRRIVEAARGFGLGRWRLVAEVILPSALPNVLMALRISLAISVGALIAAEQIGTEQGIGYLVLLAKQYFRTDYMVLCILLYATLGLAFDLLIRLAERWAMPWRR
ncbi:MAG: putative transporter integral rane subunit [Actinomycetia bacterium]|nr:putative transporter integral rane subunit [Actinomycetes bacterium]